MFATYIYFPAKESSFRGARSSGEYSEQPEPSPALQPFSKAVKSCTCIRAQILKRNTVSVSVCDGSEYAQVLPYPDQYSQFATSISDIQLEASARDLSCLFCTFPIKDIWEYQLSGTRSINASHRTVLLVASSSREHGFSPSEF